MRPLVIDELETDLVCFGSCFYYVEDRPDMFSINRIPPDVCITRLEID